MDLNRIRLDFEDSVAVLTFNHPEVLNAIGPDMMVGLGEAMAELESRPGNVRCLLITGAGRGFCPGVVLKASTRGAKREPNSREYFHITTLLHEMPKVTIAAVNGACAGAGFVWACACDLRYAAERAMFNSAFLGVAISGDMAGPWLLPRIVGATKARELFFMSQDTFHDEVRAIALRLSKSAPLAIGEMKRNFINAENMPLKDYIELETERHSRTGASNDSREAFRAFVEKREPRFEGR